jgi:DNA-binding transcriptional MerR regulator
VNKLPSIPDKKYFSIKEVSELCEVKSHTLRFWEKEFDTLKPETRVGSRRVYQKDDILMVRQIRSLLYEEGLTIAGANKRLNSKAPSKKFSSNDHLIDDLQKILKEIKQVI